MQHEHPQCSQKLKAIMARLERLQVPPMEIVSKRLRAALLEHTMGIQEAANATLEFQRKSIQPLSASRESLKSSPSRSPISSTSAESRLASPSLSALGSSPHQAVIPSFLPRPSIDEETDDGNRPASPTLSALGSPIVMILPGQRRPHIIGELSDDDPDSPSAAAHEPFRTVLSLPVEESLAGSRN